jgi:hypothetical protein
MVFYVPIYHGYGVEYTMGRGSKYHGYGGQNTIDRGFDIPWVGGQNYMGRGLIYRSFPHNFLLILKNYTYFICQKRMILFTNNRLIH